MTTASDEIKPGTWVEASVHGKVWDKCFLVGLSKNGIAVLQNENGTIFEASPDASLRPLPPEPRRIKKTVWITLIRYKSGTEDIAAHFSRPSGSAIIAIHGPLEIEFVEGGGL